MKEFFRALGIVASIVAGLVVAKIIVEIIESSSKNYFEVDKGY